MHQELIRLIAQAKENHVSFQEVTDTLRRHWEFTPVAFVTGEGTARRTENAAGTNMASCLLLAAARRLGLDVPTTLALYAEHYRAVLADPSGSAHANIRALMDGGWGGVRFAAEPLRLKGPG